MKLNFDETAKELLPSFKSCLWCVDRPANKYPWYSRSPTLCYLVDWMIYAQHISGSGLKKAGRYNKGDRVKYNWMARVSIYSAIETTLNSVFTVERHIYNDQTGVEFTDGDSCDGFWLRKAYFWEK